MDHNFTQQQLEEAKERAFGAIDAYCEKRHSGNRHKPGSMKKNVQEVVDRIEMAISHPSAEKSLLPKGVAYHVANRIRESKNPKHALLKQAETHYALEAFAKELGIKDEVLAALGNLSRNGAAR